MKIVPEYKIIDIDVTDINSYDIKDIMKEYLDYTFNDEKISNGKIIRSYIVQKAV